MMLACNVVIDADNLLPKGMVTDQEKKAFKKVIKTCEKWEGLFYKSAIAQGDIEAGDAFIKYGQLFENISKNIYRSDPSDWPAINAMLENFSTKNVTLADESEVATLVDIEKALSAMNLDLLIAKKIFIEIKKQKDGKQ